MYYRNFLISYQFIQFEFTLTCLQLVAIHFISLLRINQIFLFIYLFLFSPSCFLNSDHVLSKIFSKIRLKSEITCSRICSFALLIRKPSLTWILPPLPPNSTYLFLFQCHTYKIVYSKLHRWKNHNASYINLLQFSTNQSPLLEHYWNCT